MGIEIRNARIIDEKVIKGPLSIFISQDSIAGVGEEPLEKTQGEKYEVLDAQGNFLIPGLVDCHTHLYQTFGRGFMDDIHITRWLEVIWQFPQIFSEEALYYSTLLGAMEAIGSGTTMVADLIEGKKEDPIIQAIIDSGLRAVVGKMENDFPEGENTPVRSTEECLRDSERFFKRWQKSGNGRINVRFSFAGLPASTPELVKGLVNLSKEYGVGIHAHAAEGKEPTLKVWERFGKGEVETLDELGALTPSTLLAHVIWVVEKEMEILKERETSVVHCPFTNCKVTDGVSPMFLMAKKGVNVTFGCDGGASSSNYDLIKEAQYGSLLQKVFSMQEGVFNPRFLLEALTVNGAKALGMDRKIGKIQKGFKADLVVLQLPPSKCLSWDTFLPNLMYSSSGTEAVQAVIINGRILFKDRRFTLLNEERILGKAKEVFEKEKEKLIDTLKKTLGRSD